MDNICKYSDSEIVVSSGQLSEEPASVKDVLKDLDVFEEEMGVLLDDLSKVDVSISNFKDRCGEVADEINNLGNTLALFSGEHSNKTKGVLGAVSSATRFGGWVISKYKRSQARKEFQIKQDAVLQKKKQIAEEKLPVQIRQYEKLKNQVGSKVESLYSKDWERRIDLSDPLLLLNVRIFRLNMSIVIRYRFLSSVVSYCIEEMKAWINGKQDSGLPYPSVCGLLASEFGTWPERLGCPDKSWDGLMSEAIDQGQGEIPLPVLTVLADPCLTRNFVGVNIGESDNCPDALIRIDGKNRHCANPIADGNLYLEHCRHVFENDYHSPESAPGFGLLDLVVLLALPAVFFGVLCLIFHLESSAFWRIVFIVPSLCWLGLGIEYYEQNYDRVFPYVRRIDAYNTKIRGFRKMIASKGDCKEFHVIG